ncbi:heme ABC transporter ATP-binding protein [Salinicola peritrichatus]|uniref:heme ABC transporter ATP-binding protein n=1 Tax=Salinicola peritrichatus TaxID=1267424 RepID=UPI000DA184B1|nr:heme ABC transporter ATP-binding protein [Salinicola peritrichatus]
MNPPSPNTFENAVSAIDVVSVSLTLGGKRVLHDIDLRCEYGRITALIGPNGAGKSSLLSLIAGDEQADTGEVRLAGDRLTDLSIAELAARRAVMPQDSVLRFAYQVEEVVRMGRALRDLPPEQDDTVVTASLHAAEIGHLATRDATTLSGGEQARTTFARVLTQQTPILLLDEPTAALDLRHQERLLKSVGKLAQAGCCVVVVLHDLNLAAAHADHLVLLAEGKIQAQGTPWQVLDAERLGNVYRQPVSVISHPQRDCPIVVTCDTPSDEATPDGITTQDGITRAYR